MMGKSSSALIALCASGLILRSASPWPGGALAMPRKKQHKCRVYLLVGEPGAGASAVGYVRYSSDMQQAASIATQKRSIQRLADQKGWIIVAWYEEHEQSAKHEEEQYRPQFAALLRAAGVAFQVVVCYDTSRWSRNVEVGHRS